MTKSTEQPPSRLALVRLPGETDSHAMARSELEPETRHAVAASNLSADLFANARGGLGDHFAVGVEAGRNVLAGDLSVMSRTLTAQALTLDALFTQMLRKAVANMAEYPDAAEKYMRIGLKAQTQSRATIESLISMHQPREQTVRHIHVGPQGQAVFIENLHGGLGNAKIDGPVHAQSSAGPALLGDHPQGNRVPVTGGKREEAMPNARRRGRQRRADRE